MLPTTARCVFLSVIFLLTSKIISAGIRSNLHEEFKSGKTHNNSLAAISNEDSLSVLAYIAAPALPGNDECINAYLIPTSTSCLNSRGTLTGASASAGVPIGSCTGNPDDDVWYKFVATKTNPTITLSNIAASITGTASGSRL
ncbi:MAG: hypothetical protein JJE22_04645, partial [Bacteroidia bacterium]|nr:hypothetical protein [Bacteroidia bacterium]